MTPKTRALAGSFILSMTGTSSGSWESHLLFLRCIDTTTVKIFASEKIRVELFLSGEFHNRMALLEILFFLRSSANICWIFKV
jgi:hypothetical protein